jgi:2-(1,2-epoxy-1,2-dihydrophenyl)acetyl-CoA isomerase
MYTSVPGLDVAYADGVLRLELARPAKRNAIDDPMMYGLLDAIDAAGRDDAVRVILLTGAGEDFCAGFDIIGRNAPGAPKPRAGSMPRRRPGHAHRLIPLLAEVQTPVVCAVHGWTAGIGLAIALAADFTIAAADTRFWAPFTERGFTADSGVSWMLPRRIGEVRAREMLELGRIVSGTEAAEWCMVHRSVDGEDADLEAAVGELVGKLASSATVALGLTKWLQHAGARSPFEAHLRNEAFAMELSSRTEDFRIGMRALVDKQAPVFTGR